MLSEQTPLRRACSGPPACRCTAERRGGGFSLVETLVVVVVVAILAGIAVPSFAGLMRETRLSAVSNELLSALLLARSEAVKRKRRVSLCPSVTQVECGARTGWQHGWIVFEDADGDGRRAADEPVLMVARGQAGNLTVVGNAAVRDYISYVPTGETRLHSGALQMGTVTVCEDGSAKRVVIAATGRPRIIRKAEC